ncbi:MAG: hypothetical protein WCZ28_09960 [Burkholderiaceae bacterium]
MVFSIFGRKQRQNPPKSAAAAAVRESAANLRESPLSAREAARLTAQKIDQIESEMIHGGATALAAANSTHMLTEPASTTRAAATGTPAADAPAGEGQPGAGGQAMAIDVSGSALPPELEEAAILYANDQIEPAIASLEPTLADGGRTPGFDRLVWLVMLDLCQFSGDKQRFDTVSVDFAARFETSPPVWNEQLAPDDAEAIAAPAVGAARTLPAVLDAGCAKAVDTMLRSARQREPVVDFSAVTAVDAAGAAEILRLFDTIASSGASLRIKGAAALAAAARAAIEPGGESQALASWTLALYGLRLLGQTQQFDDLSIDYCVTFEVSPPPWEPVPEGILVDGPERAGGRDETLDDPTTTRSGPPTRVASAFVLSGELVGRIQAELQSLRAHARDRSEIAVDCRDLRRMDFVAAGELLNEVVNMQALGKNLLFIEPNHVVYALMLVMGIHELAEIRRRLN